MNVKQVLAIIAGGLAVASFIVGNPIVLIAVAVLLLAVIALI